MRSGCPGGRRKLLSGTHFPLRSSSMNAIYRQRKSLSNPHMGDESMHASMFRRRLQPSRQSNYWWNNEIGTSRAARFQARKLYQRLQVREQKIKRRHTYNCMWPKRAHSEEQDELLQSDLRFCPYKFLRCGLRGGNEKQQKATLIKL